jgi:tetratricopeptide (TPR) repeat protein
VSPQGDLLYVNTVVGEYRKAEPSRISVRAVALVTVSKVLAEALEEEGVEGFEAAYESYRADPVRGGENTVGEMITYGYSFLLKARMTEALTVFEINAAGNPAAAAAQYHLGEAYRYAGRADDAIAQYRRVLELDPEHAPSFARLAQLGE